METTVNQKMKYSRITYQKRIKLIELVLQKRNSIKKAAEVLQIKLSTAKEIVKKYKNRGIITKKRSQNQSTEVNNNILSENHLEQEQFQEMNQNQILPNTNFNYQEFCYNKIAQYHCQMQMNWFFSCFQGFNDLTHI